MTTRDGIAIVAARRALTELAADVCTEHWMGHSGTARRHAPGPWEQHVR